ncbi:platelet endothelial cell adhesion molecule isoform X2 [Xenopus laevis]|uniref:Platelet endothelial cell adhesion molecule isoform X2 n=1 Tax=Xenopus laevis TaxID=8355 RepID=A0A8J1LYZ4_XENLA|nr:platelet endothelial cell adhesion molecule isoform X2 [Xenopus laevis]
MHEMNLSLFFLSLGWRILYAQDTSFSIYNAQLSANPSATLKNGNNMSVTCSVEIAKRETKSFELTPQYLFFKNNQLIYNVTSNNLNVTYNLSPARVSKSGQYSCEVIVKGKRKSSNKLIIDVTGLSKPTVSVSTNSTKEGQTIIVTCHAPEGEEPPFYFTFYKIKTKSNKHMEELGMLYSDKDSKSIDIHIEEGAHIVTFHCDVALINVPNSKASDLSDGKIVTVEEQFSTPRIEVLPSVNFTEGENITVMCSIQTSPSVSGKVDFFIQKDTHILNSSTTDTVSYFQLAKENHTGQYICKAEYEQTSKSSSVNVIVKELFKMPQLVSNIKKSNINKGAILTLICKVPGMPPPSNHTFFQLKDGKIYSKLQRLTMQVNEADSANYSCTITASSISKTSDPLDIRVYAPVSKPVLTHRNQSISMAVQGSTIDLRCKCDRGTLPITYSLLRDRKVLSTTTKTEDKAAMFQLFISEQQNSGQYQCRAYNLYDGPPMFSNTINITVITVLATWKKGLIVFVVLILVAAMAIFFYFYVERKKKGRETVLAMNRTTAENSSNKEKSAATEKKREEESRLGGSEGNIPEKKDSPEDA